ncbi:MAG: hypothetical protein PF441_00395 [Desulfuromusa sp.]|jgi:hypothetical protein|nr:hypothetical protein [Desulfuromusa sp.]
MASPIFVMEHEMRKSKAFRELPGTAIVILLDFLARRKMKKGHILNNGEIVYTFAEAKKNGIPPKTFNRNRDLLVERGFIDVTHAGSGGRKGDMTLYAISDRWKKWGTDKFVHKERPKDLRKGIGFQKYWDKKPSVSKTLHEAVSLMTVET